MAGAEEGQTPAGPDQGGQLGGVEAVQAATPILKGQRPFAAVAGVVQQVKGPAQQGALQALRLGPLDLLPEAIVLPGQWPQPEGRRHTPRS